MTNEEKVVVLHSLKEISQKFLAVSKTLVDAEEQLDAMYWALAVDEEKD